MKRVLIVGIAMLIGLAAGVPPLGVDAATSGGYRIDEDFIGTGGNVESSSSSFKSQDALGDLGVGESSGTAYSQQAGMPTNTDPTLTFIVNTSSVNLGALSTSITRTGTATFSVLNYTSYGYIVQVIGNPPNNGAHALTGLSSPTTSQTNTEQFGINLKDNATPNIGAEAAQVPSGTFSFGVAASGYNTVDNFKYVSGNTIASAPKSSGRTDYTISYIINISNNTPGGSYSGSQTLVVTGTY